MRFTRAFALCLCTGLAACAGSASPEDVQMSNALCAQGKALLASAKNQDAQDVYASATTRDGQNARAWNGLGVSDELLGHKTDAEQAYQKAIDLAPTDLTATNNLAHLYIVTDRPDMAIKLLEVHANDPSTTPTFQQNLALARKALHTKEALLDNNDADLGSYPTEGMAQAHASQARQYLGNDAKDVTITVTPEVKIPGGTPLFSVKATGKPPQKICDILNAEAFPCIAHGN